LKYLFKTVITTFGVAFLGATLTPMATAGCGEMLPTKPLLMQASYRPARIVLASDNEPGIVGLWSVTLTSQGNSGIPDGATIDWGYAQWHSDGTEIMNSGGRSPASENFCLGVWAKTGGATYKLNHVALSYDPTTGVLNGTVSVRENVTLAQGGNSFAGTFTIDVFPPGGGPAVVHLAGAITGARVTADQ
jgi:hypothetical protein